MPLMPFQVAERDQNILDIQAATDLEIAAVRSTPESRYQNVNLYGNLVSVDSKKRNGV